MKKALIIIFILILSVFIITFCSCNKKSDSDKTDETTSVSQVPFTLGKEEKTVSENKKSGKETAHYDRDNSLIKTDYYDGDKLIYSEQYVYDDSGNVTGYKYFDSDNKYIGSYMTSKQKFYNSDNKEISENDFEKLMEKYGIDK